MICKRRNCKSLLTAVACFWLASVLLQMWISPLLTGPDSSYAQFLNKGADTDPYKYPDPEDDSGTTQPLLYIPVSTRWMFLGDNLRHLINYSKVPPHKIVVTLNLDSEAAISSVSTLCTKNGINFLLHRPEKDLQVTVKMTRNFFGMFHDAFIVRNSSFAIFLEDDLRTSLDFYQYFKAAARLMLKDSTVFCASAWNDNGYYSTSANEQVFLRGSHFMGLGWMMSMATYRTHWLPLLSSINEQTIWEALPRYIMAANPDLECVFPEVPRTHHTMPNAKLAYSTSSGLQHDRFDMMRLSTGSSRRVFDLSSLAQPNYDQMLYAYTESAYRIHELDHILNFEETNLYYMCGYCDSSKREGWQTVLEAKFGMYSFGVVEPIVRGIHKEVLFFRYATNRLMVIGSQSWLFHMQDPPEKTIDGSARKLDPEDLILGAFGESCDQVCKGRQMRCNEQKLARINRCDLLSQSDICSQCTQATDSSNFHPSVSRAEGESDGGFCLLAVPRMLFCEGSSPQVKRICFCDQ